jgi:hypothetical protein
MPEALLESTTTRGSSALRIPSKTTRLAIAYRTLSVLPSAYRRSGGGNKREESAIAYIKKAPCIKGGVLKRAHTAFMYIRACTRSGRFVAKH